MENMKNGCMPDTESIFRYKKLNEVRLQEYGFTEEDSFYRRAIPIMHRQFTIEVSVSRSGEVEFKVIETELNEEYDLVNVSGAQGAFVGDVREACGKVLTDIAARCFDTEILKAEQTNRLIHFISERYNVRPEFLWAKYPGYAAFRRQDNEKWFAVIMTIDRSKIGLAGHGNIEIIDLKAEPGIVAELLKQAVCYPAYHMNKKHWFTVCLDGSLTDEELMSLTDASYECAAFSR